MNKKENYKLALVVTSLVSIILWFIILFYSNNKIINNEHHFMLNVITITLPIILITYHAYVKFKALDYFNLKDDERKEKILKHMEQEKNLANIIPVIVFGLGFLLNSIIIKNKTTSLIVPYLLLALLLGTVIPYLIMYNSFIDSNIIKLLISETLLFSSESFSFTLLISCLIIPYLQIKL
jgi:hypothetical protein